MKRWAYIFSFSHSNKLEWSADDEETLIERADSEKDKDRVRGFIESAQPGHHMQLETGEMIFRTA